MVGTILYEAKKKEKKGGLKKRGGFSLEKRGDAFSRFF